MLAAEAFARPDPDPALVGLIERQARAFRLPAGGGLGPVALVAGPHVLFVTPDEEGPTAAALAAIGAPVVRAVLDEFFAGADLGPERPAAEWVLGAVRGRWRVGAVNRWAAVVEAVAWKHLPYERWYPGPSLAIKRLVYGLLFDPDRST